MGNSGIGGQLNPSLNPMPRIPRLTNEPADVQPGNSPAIIEVCARSEVVKPGIHPKYYEVEARCACGNTWKTRSTKQELHLEICSNCHPFFTGRQKLIDTEGRVERFTKKFGAQTSES